MRLGRLLPPWRMKPLTLEQERCRADHDRTEINAAIARADRRAPCRYGDPACSGVCRHLEIEPR